MRDCVYIPCFDADTRHEKSTSNRNQLPINMATKEMPSASTNEDIALENLGYQREFKRSFSLLDTVGFSFSIVTW